MEIKLCSKCKEWKPLSEYYRSKSSKDSFRAQCKQCLNKNRTPKLRQLYYDDNIKNLLVTSARYRAKRKKLEFDISPEDITIPAFCPLLGIPLQRGRGRPSANSPSIDRIDPSKGYIKTNIWVISYRANVIKTSATYDEIITVGENLRKFITPYVTSDINHNKKYVSVPCEIYNSITNNLNLPNESLAVTILQGIQELKANISQLEYKITANESKIKSLNNKINHLLAIEEKLKNEIQANIAGVYDLDGVEYTQSSVERNLKEKKILDEEIPF